MRYNSSRQECAERRDSVMKECPYRRKAGKPQIKYACANITAGDAEEKQARKPIVFKLLLNQHREYGLVLTQRTAFDVAVLCVHCGEKRY
jgi:hypothetical protein